MFALLLILIFIRPFISSLAFPYLNSIYTFGLLGLLLIRTIVNGLPFKKIKALEYPLILFFLALIISLSFSYAKTAGLKELLNYCPGMLIFLIGASLSDKDKNKIIRAIILAGFIISILAIYQYFFGFSHILDYISKMKITVPFALDYIQRQRVFFPFVTPNTLAGYLILIIPLVLTNNNNEKWLILPPLLFALFLSKSLGAFLSIFLGMGLYLCLRKDLSGRKFALLLILAVVFVFMFALRLASPKEHVLPAFSLARRLSYWQDSLKIIQTHPLAGVGLGNFGLPSSRYAHNSYLQIWAETGIPGIVSFLWLITALFKSVFKNIKNLPDKKQILGVSTACAVFLIHNFVDFSFFLPEIALLWWVTLGLLIL